jgi:hypothetical protein
VQPSTETTVAEDKQHIKSTFTELTSCITQLKDSEGAGVIRDFLGLQDGEVVNETWIEKILDGLESKVDLDGPTDDNRFNFNVNTGTYTWNASTETWSKTSIPSDKIILNFPSKPTSITNNATLTVGPYTDEAVTIDGEAYYLPKKFSATLLVDGQKIFSVDGSASYDEPIPVNINVSVFLKPFTYTVVGNRITPTKFNAAVTIANNNGCTTSASVDFEFTHSDYELIDLDKDVKSISATIRHDNLKLVTNVNMSALSAIDDPTVSQINAYVKTNVFYNDAKIGELILFDNGSEYKVHIIYKDGTQEDTDVYYLPFIDDLENLLATDAGNIEIL